MATKGLIRQESDNERSGAQTTDTSAKLSAPRQSPPSVKGKSDKPSKPSRLNNCIEPARSDHLEESLEPMESLKPQLPSRGSPSPYRQSQNSQPQSDQRTSLAAEQSPTDGTEPRQAFLRKPIIIDEFSQAKGVNDYLDAALNIPAPLIIKRVDALRRKHPNYAPQDLIDLMTRRYLRAVSGISAGVGAGAAYPGIGAAAAAGLSVGEVAAFMSQTAYYVLVVAKLHQVAWYDREFRRTLLLASLLGEEGAKLASQQLGTTSVQWAKGHVATMTSATMAAVNRQLAAYATKKIAKRFGQNLLGKLMPFGIGAAIGWMGGRAMGRIVVEGLRASLGTAGPAREAVPEDSYIPAGLR